MKKKILVERLVEHHFKDLSKKKVNKMVNFLIEEMKRGINSQEGLRISGFGSFKRKGKRISFKASKSLNYRLKSLKM
ncbi:MAG: HU family DNA-binding protein [Aquificaceae bacterium]